MSKVPVIVALVIAISLGVITAVVLREPSRSVGVGRERALSVRAGEIRRMAIRTEDREAMTVWRVREAWIARASGVDAPWPVGSSHVRAAIAQLVEGVWTDPDRASATRPAPDREMVAVELRGTEHEWEISLGSTRVGGMRPARVRADDGEAVAALAEWQLGEVFTPEAVRAWRVMRAMPMGEPEASRIVLRAVEGEDLELVRRKGRWRLTEPLRARADAGAARRVVSTVRAAELVELLDGRDPGDRELGLTDGGVVALRIEDDRRVREGDRFRTETLVARVVVGGEVSLAGGERYLLLEGWLERAGSEPERVWGPMVATARMEDLADAFPTVDACLSRRAIGFPAADIGSIRLGAEESTDSTDSYRRRGGEWTRHPSGAPARPERQRVLAALAHLIGEVEAGVARRAPVELGSVATVEIGSFEGERVSCRVGVYRGEGEGDGSRTVGVECEGVWRVYEPTPGTELIVRWLARGGE